MKSRNDRVFRRLLTVGVSALTILVVTLPARAGGEEADPTLEEEALAQLEPPPIKAGETWDAMARILEEQRRIVTESTDPTLVGEGARVIWQTHHMSGLVVLPTPGVPETAEMHRGHVQQLEKSVEVLESRLERGELPGDDAKKLLEVKVSLEAEIDWIQTIGLWTATVKPGTPQAKVLQKRQLRAPFIPLPFLFHAPDEVVTHDVIGINECMVVVKEIQGMKVRLIYKRLPVWVEPWSARRRIVGFKIIWIVEFVPAQFIKKVVTCNDCCNEIKNEIFTEVIEHPELLNFWRYFKKGHKSHYGGY